MTTHKLIITENYLNNLLTGAKKAEIRFNDRDYQSGDILEFADYSKLEPRVYDFEITHIHSGLGMAAGYVCLSVTQCKR